MKVAFYKAKDHLFNRLVSWWDRGPYSHCELLSEHVSGNTYVCYSSSFMDGGVRKKVIDLDPKKWDIIEIDADEAFAKHWFESHLGCKYDVLGLVGFLIRIISGKKNRYFCSEALADSLGMKDGWRFTPNSLFSAVERY